MDTPNGGEAGGGIETAEEWVGFRVDLEHLQYLSPQTIRWIAREFNLTIEILDAFGFPALNQIERLPRPRSGAAYLVREFVKRIPGARRMAQTTRVLIRGERATARRDPRLGFYRLFALLRKE